MPHTFHQTKQMLVMFLWTEFAPYFEAKVEQKYEKGVKYDSGGQNVHIMSSLLNEFQEM